MWNRDAHPVATGIGANPVTVIAFITNDSSRAKARSSATWSLDSSLLHQRLEHGRFVLLSRSNHDGYRFSVSFGSNVHLGRESATAPA